MTHRTNVHADSLAAHVTVQHRTNRPADPAYFTVQEVADRLRLSRMTVYRMVADGAFPGTLHTGRHGRTIRIPETALSAHLTAAQTAPEGYEIPGQLGIDE